MKMMKTIALAAFTIACLSTTNTYSADACDVAKELSTLKAAHDKMATEATDDAAKAKVSELASKILEIKNEADQAKACQMVDEVKKTYSIQ